ncbi:P44/Msp2 family outer membrane protein [Anaplasma capra]|uniref:P44/Msp2 family outer membrane protein n=1 Tax=Anaplasma capra TaxID=1562740 RepID=UPI0021D5AD4A|nr:P44/Msp2 family outer membrane protein [Anaplasma capra]
MQNNFYAGLTFNPTYSSVQNFRIRDAGQRPLGVLAYEGGMEVHAEQFDWSRLDATAEFEDSKFPAFGGMIGFWATQSLRVEFEAGRDVFPIKGGDTGKGGVFLLIRDLAHTIMTQNDADAIAHQLIQQVGSDRKKIRTALTGITAVKLPSQGEIEQHFRRVLTGLRTDSRSLEHAVNKLASGRMAEKYKYDTTTVAQKIAVLGTSDAAKVASSFIRVAEGATVVRFKDITSTSAILNVCRDIRVGASEAKLVPYACGGVGLGHVSMSGETDLKLLYKVKGGIGYEFMPGIRLIAGMFLQGTFDDVRHRNLDTDTVVGDDTGASRRASALFGLRCFGINVGASFSM